MKNPNSRQIVLYIIIALMVAAILYSAYSAILWLNGDATAEPLYTLTATLVSLLLATFTWLRQRANPTVPDPNTTFDITIARNRQIRTTLLDNIQAEIVSGYLHNTFHEMFKWLDLGKQYQPQALQRHASYHRPDFFDQPIPPRKAISQLFRDSGRALLILGAPGSGKTFTLAELAHDLLGEAQINPTAPVPVILNLASWVTHQLPLLDWLTDTLNIEQQLARDTARTWVSHGALTLLLDGLDEVADDLRNDCVTAINTFRDQYTVEIAITSRLEEYENLHQQLNLGHAVRLLPLTDSQIYDYLDSLGPNSRTIQQALTHDRALHSLAQTPLTLHIIAIAYHNLTPDQLQPLNTIIERRQHLYDTYIQRRLDDFHKTQLLTTVYTPAQALHWLIWLAQRMKALDQTNFYIERLQTYWLPHALQRRRHVWYVGFAGALFGGLALGLAFGLPSGLVGGPVFGLAMGLAFGLPSGLAFGLANGHDAFHSSVPLAEALKLTWPSRKEIIIAVVLGLVGALAGGWIGGPIFGLMGALASAVPISLVFGLNSYEINHNSQRPNQGVARSLHTARQAFLTFGLAFGLALGSAGGLVFGPGLGLAVALTGGFAFGLAGALGRGGDAIINNWFLQHTLAVENYLPRDLIPYLDHMARLILLQRVGGGYRFLHLTLRDHLARQNLS